MKEQAHQPSGLVRYVPLRDLLRSAAFPKDLLFDLAAVEAVQRDAGVLVDVDPGDEDRS
jgi:hypothetical protein